VPLRNYSLTLTHGVAILGLAYNHLRLDHKDLQLDLRLGDLQLAQVHLQIQDKTYSVNTLPSVNTLIINSEHLLLIMHSLKSYEHCPCEFKYSHGVLV